MKRCPSIKTLTDHLHLSPLDALTLRTAMRAGIGLACTNRLLDAHGVEYVNRDDTYDITICKHNGTYVVCARSDIVERYDR